MRAKKSLGQHFLMHAQIAERMADAARMQEGATALEIGPGRGILTRALLARARKVIAVETDAELVEELKGTFAKEIGEGNLVLIHADIRAFDARSIDGPYALVANIPYYITGEIMRQFLSGAHKPSSMTLLVQKEVAERITLRGPAFKKKKESLLSLSVKAYGTPRYEFPVPRGAFLPPPSVDSAVVTVADISENAFADAGEEERFFRVLREGFAHKRKRLAKNLEALALAATITDAFTNAGIPPDIRPEDLPLSAWRALASRLP